MVELIRRHKIHFLFLKHIKYLSCMSRIDYRIIGKLSNELFCFQFIYKEYLENLEQFCNYKVIQNAEYAILKGFSFIHDLYTENNVMYRPFGDVDILIQVEKIQDVDTVLKKLHMIQGKIVEDKIIAAPRRDIVYWRLNSHQLHEYVKFSKYSQVSSIYKVDFDINTSIFECIFQLNSITVPEGRHAIPL